MPLAQFDRRPSGLAVAGDLPWGSHFCQFYQTKQDLLDVLVPYFKAGLATNEMCSWVIAEPLTVEEARDALRDAVPGFAECAERGQIEIVPDSEAASQTDADLIARLDRAIAGGFDGVRLACPARPTDESGRAFALRGLQTIRRRNVVAAFLYPRDRFDAVGLMEVVKNHRFALVRNGDQWEVLESSEARTVADALERTEEKLRSLFGNMSEGFAYHRIVLDGAGRPCDYVFLEINEAFARLTGLEAEAVVGENATRVLPGIDKDSTDWIGRFGRVAMTGQPARFESYSAQLERWYSVSAFSPQKGYFAVTFSDITDRKRAEEALRASEERLGVTLRSIGDAVISTDTEGRVVLFNRVSEELTGWTQAEAVGRPFADVFRIVNEQTGAPAEDPVRKVIERGTVVALANHTLLIAKDGRRIAIADSAAPVRGDGGELLGVVLVFRDVTAERQAEQTLRESEQRFKVIAANTPDHISVQDRHLRYQFVINPGLGLTEQNMMGKTEYDFLTREDADRLTAIKWQVLETGRAAHLEVPLTAPDGSRQIFDGSYVPRFDADGRPDGVIAYFKNITERKRAEEELRTAHRDLEQKVKERTADLEAANRTLRMITACDEALVRITDETELVRQICKTIYDLGAYRFVWVGYAEEDKSVRPVASVGFEDGYLEAARITWADEARGRGPTGTCIRTGAVRVCGSFLEPGLQPWREEAAKRGYQSSIALPLQSGGRVFGALTIYAAASGAFDAPQVALLAELADDLALGIMALRTQVERDNARQEAERRALQLRALATELGQTEQRERQRLARLLHDQLQQLLVGAKFGLAGIAASRATQAKLQAVRDVVDDAIKASRSLTAELSPPVLHERGLTAGLEWLARQMAEKHGLKVSVRGNGDLGTVASQVRLFLFDAVRELLFNAVKHAGVDKAHVEVARARGDQIRVTVVDRGVGFDPAALAAGDVGNSGFGLFSIRERLSYLGGCMDIQSAPGRGSRFTITAPAGVDALVPAAVVARTDAPPASAVATSAPRGRGEKIRIVLADDHEVFRQGLARVLAEQADLEVVGEAADGVAVVALARKLRPDVVLMDASMPRADGVEATRQIAAELPATRVIGLSMHEETDMASAMREAGAVAYCTKTVAPGVLVAAIRVHAAPGSPGDARDSGARPRKSIRTRAPIKPVRSRRKSRHVPKRR